MFGKDKPLEQQTQMVLLENDETLINRIGCKHKKITHFTDGSKKAKNLNGVLNITTKRVAVSVDGVIEDNAFAGYGIPLKNIRMVFPLKKDKIRVHYIGYNEKYNISVRYQMIYDLEQKESQNICQQITDAIINNTQNTASENKRLFLFSGEKIIKQVNCTTRKFEGIFYVTNLGLYLEDHSNGLAFEMPYSMYHKSGLHNNTVVIQYNEMHDDGSIKVHEFQVRPDSDSNGLALAIKKQYNSSNANSEHDFESLKSMFGNLSGEELRQILYKKPSHSTPKITPQTTWADYSFSNTDDNSYNLQKYIGYLADKKWGDTRPKVKWCYCSSWFAKDTLFGQRASALVGCHINGENRKRILDDPEKFYTEKGHMEWHQGADFHFRQYEMMLVKAALFADVSLDVIGGHTDEYLSMMEKFQKDFDYHREAEMSLVEWHNKMESFKEKIKNAKDKDDYIKITKSPEYVKCVEQHTEYKKIRSQYTDKKDSHYNSWDGKVEFDFNSTYWEKTYRDSTLKEFHTVLRKIYDEWKKNIPLQDFTDDVDFSWLQYCLENVPYTTKDMAFFTNAKDDIRASLARSDGVKKSLESFRVPDEIPPEDIFSSDCWHDKKKKMWFSRCELAEKAVSVATISNDDAARKWGYFALGFDESLVELKHGIPAISIPYDVFPNEKVPEEKRYILLSYVREDQITPQMEKDRFRTVRYIENTPYTFTFKQKGEWAENETNKKLAIAAYEKYKKTGINDQETSGPPDYVSVNVLEYLTVEPREGLRNDGFNNFSTPVELTLVEKRSEPKEYSFMNIDYPDSQLPLYERIRKHIFKTLTGQPVVTYKDDFENVKKEYDLLFGSSRQESQILPTVQV